MTRKSILFLLFALLIVAVSSVDPDKLHLTKIKASPQRSGNALKGYDYLVNGDYVSSGIPYDIFSVFGPKDSSNLLNREGDSAFIPPQFNLIENESGVKILAPNCLTCHSDYINGEFIPGLGNNSFDYRYDVQGSTTFIKTLISNKYGEASPEYRAFIPFHNASKALSGQLQTKARGVNPADKLTAVLVAHRDPETLEWTEEAQLEIPEENIPTDVPPWWLLKKKHAMFYTGIGRGDFSKFLMASSILTLTDTSEARQIDEHFPDVLAWINSLNPPEYPEEINESLALKGERLFELNCSKCHGSYGDDESYPNLLVAPERIQTDPYLSMAYTDTLYSTFVDWYERSWFAQGSNPGKVVIEPGYVAPPLDGIWASAPYFHNGSVPSIEAVLNSEIRPELWSRTYDSTDYNFNALGWNYESCDSSSRYNCYDTSIPGYGNMGHYFGDDLEQDERMAIIEYLKTL